MDVEESVVKKGDTQEGTDWLRELYDEHRDLVFRYVVSRCGRDAALDVVSETFVEAARSRDKFDPDRGSISSWLLGIATNRIHRWQRTESRYTGLADGRRSSLGADDENLVELPGRMDDRRSAIRVRKAVSGLPEGERNAFLLSALEGLTTREVAASLDISATAAKLRIFRARRRLRTDLDDLNQKEGSA